jgi:hypothetical protein
MNHAVTLVGQSACAGRCLRAEFSLSYLLLPVHVWWLGFTKTSCPESSFIKQSCEKGLKEAIEASNSWDVRNVLPNLSPDHRARSAVAMACRLLRQSAELSGSNVFVCTWAEDRPAAAAHEAQCACE